MKTTPLTLIATLGAGLLLAAGCASTPPAIVGHPASELTAKLGPPTQKKPDGHGGEIWVYLEDDQLTSAAHLNPGTVATHDSSGTHFDRGYHGSLAFDATSDTSSIRVLPSKTRKIQIETDYYVDPSGTVYRVTQ
jgi:hypothetical protein